MVQWAEILMSVCIRIIRTASTDCPEPLPSSEECLTSRCLFRDHTKASVQGQGGEMRHKELVYRRRH